MGILHSGIMSALPGVHVRACCESQKFVLKAARALLPKSIGLYANYRIMVEKEQPDAIFINTPIDTHSEIIAEIMSANPKVSIFVEKPLAATGNQAKLACEAIRGGSGVYMVGFQKRFSPVYRKAKEIVEGGQLGDLMFFRASSFSSDVLREGGTWRFRKGSGGVLLDLAPHLLDLLIWFFGEPSGISSVRRSLFSREVDDYVHADLNYPSGLEGHLDVCWSIAGYRLPETSIELYGKDGSVTVTDDYVKFKSRPQEGKQSAAILYKQSFDMSVPFLLADPEYTLEDQAFLLSVERKRQPDLSFGEGAKTNSLIDRIAQLDAG